jgi:hypothetical protein
MRYDQPMTQEVIAEQQPLARATLCDRIERQWCMLSAEVERQRDETERGPDVRLFALLMECNKQLATLWQLGKPAPVEPEPEPEPDPEAERVDAATAAAQALARATARIRDLG